MPGPSWSRESAKHCDLCKLDVSRIRWSSHLKGASHRCVRRVNDAAAGLLAVDPALKVELGPFTFQGPHGREKVLAYARDELGHYLVRTAGGSAQQWYENEVRSLRRLDPARGC